jgi:hypothetical protein
MSSAVSNLEQKYPAFSRNLYELMPETPLRMSNKLNISNRLEEDAERKVNFCLGNLSAVVGSFLPG